MEPPTDNVSNIRRANYNRLSRWYDLLSGSSEREYRNLGIQQLNIQPGEAVLEIGSGTGHALLIMAEEVGNAGKVYGIDISEGMLQIVQGRIQKTGHTNQINLIQGNGTYIPCADDSFNAIFLSFTLELFNDDEIPMVLAECLRVLRHNGRLCIVSLAKTDKINLITHLYEWMHRIFPSVIDCHPICVDDLLVKSWFQIQKEIQLSMWGLPVTILTAVK